MVRDVQSSTDTLVREVNSEQSEDEGEREYDDFEYMNTADVFPCDSVCKVPVDTEVDMAT